MPDNIDLTNLTAQQGFIIQGDAEGDYAGFSVSLAGDVNGDGIDDIIIGAPRGDDGGPDAGEAYVIFGTRETREALHLSTLSPEDGFIIQGASENDFTGGAVTSGGDVNGDGIGDIVIGAPNADDGTQRTGEVYVVYGTTEQRDIVDLNVLSQEDGFVILGDADGDDTGTSLSAGDVNGDGIDDIVLSAPYGDDGGEDAGETYVVYGTPGVNRGSVDLTDLAVTDGFIIQGDVALDEIGFSVSSVGDVNGDGIDDIVVGAPFSDYAEDFAGQTYVIYGINGTNRGIVDLTDLASTDGFIIAGDTTYDQTGASVSSAGDVNGDGIDDIIIGAPENDNGGRDAGIAYIVYGTTEQRDAVDLGTLTPSQGFVIQGGGLGDRVGSIVSAGDVNADGITDVIVTGGEDSPTYIIFGSTDERDTIMLPTLGTEEGFQISVTAESLRPNDIASGGDVNGDGIDDIILGIPQAGPGLSRITDQAFAISSDDDTGEAYVIYGAATTEGQTIVDDSSGSFITGDAGSDVIAGIAGQNVIGGGLGGDLLVGGFDGDILAGGIGDDVIIGDNNALISAGDALTGGVGDDLLEGGGGTDTFIFNPQNGHDTIGQIAVDYDNLFLSTVVGADFVSGVDRVRLDGFDIRTGEEALAFVTDVDGVATFASEGTVITFAGLTTADLSADDFTFA